MEELAGLLALIEESKQSGTILDPNDIYKSLGMDPVTKQMLPDGPSGQASGYGSRATRPFKEAANNARTSTGPMRRLRQTAGTVGGATDAALGLTELGRSQTKAIAQGVQSGSKMFGAAPTVAARNGRLAMQALRHPAMAAGLKWAGPVGAAMAAGDLVLGDESLANKGMDAAFMTAGGFLGSAVPVVGTGIGIAAGKMVSDGTQFLFGGGKSPKERELEQALALLQQRGLI